MKICWDNLNKLRYNEKTGKWYIGQNTYVYIDSCQSCKEPYLSRSYPIGDFCDRSCSNKNNNNPLWKHGKSHTSTYISWTTMKQRCLNESFPKFSIYGGRGIKICERWLNSFENFLADMGERPEGKTLDRIDNDGNYEPSNCKWSTPKEQANNRSNNI